ncbi:RNA polymerase factor sigma-54 [Succinivibrio dextrinosolvens]|uniref:RNA polymerase factor sigma-54 n=1 Tax=Succinivibrio dextrinosolvens TaxID=83771 RepID=UPI00247A05DA|nr:RNA polymerase factor sigma-54 [Succinivibrio dextrinosolvens]
MAGIRNALQLRTAQTQTLSMTPQLQQAIKLLQLSSIELEQEIQQVLEENPFLEKVSQDSNDESLEALEEKENSDTDSFDPFDNDSSARNVSDSMIENDNYGNENYDPFDDSKTNSLSDSNVASQDESVSTDSTDTTIKEDELIRNDDYINKSVKGLAIENNEIYEGETTETLHDHLMFQLEMSPLDGTDKLIAMNIIDAVNDSGYITESLEDILLSVQKDDPEATIEDVKAILKLVQHYDPLGVASRDAAECMLIQLNELDNSTPYRDLAIKVISEYSDLLSNRDFRSLCQKMSIKENVLKEIIAVLKKLNPRPGNFAPSKKTDFVIPDVIVVKKSDGSYTAELNTSANTLIRINEAYSQLSKQARTVQEKEFFKSHLQEANWFISSLEKRNETLLKVSRCIVEHQTEFMDKGPSAMKPMVLNDVATEIEMHESTISRITTEKYIYTPKGTFELKYFFSSSVGTDDGGAASATAVKSFIKDLIAGENPRKPLSDSKLSELLLEKGMNVARRTVAKYREALGIESSSQRKKLI